MSLTNREVYLGWKKPMMTGNNDSSKTCFPGTDLTVEKLQERQKTLMKIAIERESETSGPKLVKTPTNINNK